jgi:hypothetical protein
VTGRLRTRIERLEHGLQPKARMIIVRDDGMEDIEARIERCKAETQATLADLIVIIKRFTRDPDRGAEAPWNVRPMLA